MPSFEKYTRISIRSIGERRIRLIEDNLIVSSSFVFNKTTKKLTIMQRPRSEEEVLLWLFNYRPDFNLLQDPFANQWLKDYSLATCKMMLGEAREKFNQIASPQGGTSLNGTALKGEGKAELETLEMDLVNYKDGGTPLTFVIG
jgi:hypothetical protein